jgi:hypothetical protein
MTPSLEGSRQVAARVAAVREIYRQRFRTLWSRSARNDAMLFGARFSSHIADLDGAEGWAGRTLPRRWLSRPE